MQDNNDLEKYLEEFLEDQDTPGLKIPLNWTSPLDLELIPRDITPSTPKEKTHLRSKEVALRPKKKSKNSLDI